jgi:hypothetical protein
MGRVGRNVPHATRSYNVIPSGTSILDWLKIVAVGSLVLLKYKGQRESEPWLSRGFRKSWRTWEMTHQRIAPPDRWEMKLGTFFLGWGH